MRITRVRDGDIVEVNDGLSYLAVVRGRNGRRLVVAPIGGKFRPAPVRPTDIVGHWRKVRPTASKAARERESDRQPRQRATKEMPERVAHNGDR